MSSAAFLLERLQERSKDPIAVAVVGAGMMGPAIARQIARTPGMRVAAIVSRSEERARAAWATLGQASPTAAHSLERLETAVAGHQPAFTSDPEIVGAAAGVDVVLDVTGDVEIGVRTALSAIEHRKVCLSFAAETDALFGVTFARMAAARGALYGFADGDQPGVMARFYDEATLWGFDVRGIFNCKGFHNVRATPASIAEWCAKNCGTSPKMTCSFTDGTKMALELNIAANLTGFVPKKRGMFGVKTTIANAATDIVETLGLDEGDRVVDFTLGGDFGGAIFLLCKDRDGFDQERLRYYKAGGPGPWRILVRPYHMCNFEVPLSIAEAVILRRALAVQTQVAARTIAIAKEPLRAGQVLDGIGGYHLYGVLDAETSAAEFLPISLAEGARLLRDYAMDEPIALADVELPDGRARELFLSALPPAPAARAA